LLENELKNKHILEVSSGIVGKIKMLDDALGSIMKELSPEK
jgi:hypothetical protein